MSPRGGGIKFNDNGNWDRRNKSVLNGQELDIKLSVRLVTLNYCAHVEIVGCPIEMPQLYVAYIVSTTFNLTLNMSLFTKRLEEVWGRLGRD